MAKGLRVLGHPLHAALSHVPMGLLGSAPLWDAVGVWRGGEVWWAVSYWCVVAGLVAASAAAATGVADYAAIEEGDPALDTVNRHVLLIVSALAPYFMSIFVRGGQVAQSGWTALGVLMLDGAGLILLSAGGWHGGHLVFHHGVGVEARVATPLDVVSERTTQ